MASPARAVDMNGLACIGASVRLAELAAERNAILNRFPGLGDNSATPTPAAAPDKTGKAEKRNRRKVSKERRRLARRRLAGRLDRLQELEVLQVAGEPARGRR